MKVSDLLRVLFLEQKYAAIDFCKDPDPTSATDAFPAKKHITRE